MPLIYIMTTVLIRRVWLPPVLMFRVLPAGAAGIPLVFFHHPPSNVVQRCNDPHAPLIMNCYTFCGGARPRPARLYPASQSRSPRLQQRTLSVRSVTTFFCSRLHAIRPITVHTHWEFGPFLGGSIWRLLHWRGPYNVWVYLTCCVGEI